MTARSLDDLAADGLLDPEWAHALGPVASDIAALGDRLRADERGYLPEGRHVLRAFAQPLSRVRVLIVGQDPYPTPGHPIGLSFAVERHVRPLPRSLANIYAELSADLGIPPASHGDLSAWTEQGVLLLNRVLTVAPGEAGSHRGLLPRRGDRRKGSQVSAECVRQPTGPGPVRLGGGRGGDHDHTGGARRVPDCDLGDESACDAE